MKADQPVTSRTISTDRLYTRIESTNWLLDRGIATVGTLQKERSGIPSELFDTHKIEKEKKNIFNTSYTVKIKSKGKKMLLRYRPPDHCMTNQLMAKKSPK